jgi:predicted transcriptional regulator|tara:strand:+ start:717 stop:881 length:165 start_codon:yes stop_codon:yes gene_type:complete
MDDKNKNGRHKQIAIRLRAEVWDALDDYWVKTRISKTAIVEMAIRDFLDGVESK